MSEPHTLSNVKDVLAINGNHCAAKIVGDAVELITAQAA